MELTTLDSLLVYYEDLVDSLIEAKGMDYADSLQAYGLKPIDLEKGE